MPANRQTVPRAEREEEILAAAAAELAEHGFRDATIAGIARRAGMTAANVHYYFPNRDALVAVLVERAYSSLFAELDAIDGADDRLRRYIDFHMRAHRLRAEFQALVATNDALRDVVERREQWLATTAARVCPDPVDAEILRVVVTGIVESTRPDPDAARVLDAALERLPSAARAGTRR